MPVVTGCSSLLQRLSHAAFIVAVSCPSESAVSSSFGGGGGGSLPAADPRHLPAIDFAAATSSFVVLMPSARRTCALRRRSPHWSDRWSRSRAVTCCESLETFAGAEAVGPWTTDSGIDKAVGPPGDPACSVRTRRRRSRRKRTAREYRIDYASWIRCRPAAHLGNGNGENDITGRGSSSGDGSLFPLQAFRGAMAPGTYDGWLRSPLGDESTTLLAIPPVLPVGRPLPPRTYFRPIHIDPHLLVLSKLSGVLSVPGPRRRPSLAALACMCVGNDSDDVDKMAVHRLDRDTSGVLVLARSDEALLRLNKDFRERYVKKTYEAVVCGHLPHGEGSIDLPLRRDPRRMPFMCVGVPLTEGMESREVVAAADMDAAAGNGSDGGTNGATGKTDNRSRDSGFAKLVSKSAKPSVTEYRVLAWEWLDVTARPRKQKQSPSGADRRPLCLPVTRIELTPITGRTHQLRVHCAAIGHPILGDSIYGAGGDGSPDAGFSEETMDGVCPSRAGRELQGTIRKEMRRRRLLHSQGLEPPQLVCGEGCEGENFGWEDLTGGAGNLCLHARRLCLWHPVTGSPMSFEVDTPF